MTTGSTVRMENLYLSYDDLSNLQVGDEIDHRDKVGRFTLAIIVAVLERESSLMIHYDGWPSKWDTWSDYTKELYRFAAPNSISKRPAHRFTDLKIGDFVDINPLLRHPGWKRGEIRQLDGQSGQVQVVYDVNGKNYMVWAHLDNETEIAAFMSKSVIKNNKKRKIENNSNNRPAKKMKLCLPKTINGKKINEARSRISDDLNLIFNSNQELIKENEELKMENGNLTELNINLMKQMDDLQKKVDELEYKPERINAMSLEQLSNLENSLQGKIRLIQNAQKNLMEDALHCIVCKDNKKNVSFADGCDHVSVCDECEEKMERKCCPLCNAAYTKVKKLTL